jgi:quercetin dioxygenase-like cupin family protein
MAHTFERPFVPVDLAEQAAATFPLQGMIEQLRDEDVFRDSSRNALTLLHDSELTAVLAVAKEGTQCAEHAASQPTIVVNLAGKLEIRGSSGGVIQLVQNSAAVLAPEVVHKFAAVTDCAYLLIIGGNQKTQG